jgi:hypothetical protein
MYSQTHEVDGEGIISDIKDRFNLFRKGPRNIASKRLLDELKMIGGERITGIQVGRKPITSIVDKALNVISRGRFGKAVRAAGYDNLYHNYMLVTLASGRVIKIEKNHIIEMSDVKDSDYSNEIYTIPVTKEVDLDKMLESASKNNADFYKYSGNERQNCQSFTTDMIVKNGLTPTNPVIIQNQKVDGILDKLPLGHVIPDAITNLAGRLDRVVYGDGSISQRYRL